MYEQTLIQAGLSKEQAAVYEALLKQGPQKAAKISQKTPYKRALVYKILGELQKIGLVERKDEPKQVSIFVPKHPINLREMVEKQEKQVKDAHLSLDSALPDIIADFNLISDRPGIKVFEGKEGIIEAYKIILAENKPINSIEDDGSMEKFIPDYIPKYVEERIQRKLFNRSISPESNKINDSDPSKLIKGRRIPNKLFPFSMDIKIAGEKVLLTTLKKDTAVAVLMQHPEISRNFQILFEYLWSVVEKKLPDEQSLTAEDSSDQGQESQ